MDKAMNPNPDRRMGSASEMASALREALLPGTVCSPTGIAFEALEAEMLPYEVARALSDGIPAVDAYGGTRHGHTGTAAAQAQTASTATHAVAGH